ncbi:nucleotide sugar dehydrogenase [Acinetobacter sp. NIPH 2699]|uniref:nucleotide sugar dehydrogenase n=1 Tax=Acinetobacter sp. NIPH 2699 TaxID=2923433 RepID=UPI001F4A2518|nr:nucleotide sugar dehydrogenase [Acinetobacter sp. NIPH 2699]MCH7336488.1 nucleotide sugar dehydrogenase [Acinetobacter sp. NIPH 2699]
MKITVVGAGYVGLSNALLFSKQHDVIVLDIDKTRINQINQKVSPISDACIQSYLSESHLEATCDKELAYQHAKLIIIATPTNYNPETNYFDTSSIETVIAEIQTINPKALMLIKSTVPVGYTAEISNKLNLKNLIFSPEFLREGQALQDNLYPSRIIVGEKSKRAEKIAKLYLKATIKKDAVLLCVDSTEAEAIKLFSNTYLAMRVAFFNELDTYCLKNKLSALDIIKGVGLDPRIGDHYNNPSFGYGGYCLPKDTKQLLANYHETPQELISAIIRSNQTRKQAIIEDILSRGVTCVGVYRLTMKADSDNFRESAVHDVLQGLADAGIKIMIYEPTLVAKEYMGHPVEANLQKFKSASDLIIVNRMVSMFSDVMEKIYSRDLFGVN